MTVILLSRQCQRCDFLQEVKDNRWTCKAFLEGIPTKITLEMHDHTTAYKGDKGIVFSHLKVLDSS